MPRFVLLYHDCPPGYARPSHWDLMLESGDALRTWALDRLPHNWSAIRSRTAASFPNCPAAAFENTVAALQLGDHRREYLRFEGPVSENRGSVKRVVAGTYSSETETSDCWRIAFKEGDLSGIAILRKTSSNDTQWRLEGLAAS